MRNGFILLHRQGLTPEEWKHPLRTLAWIDLLTMAAWEDFTNENAVSLKRGEIIASESFLATRWRQNRGTVHRWLLYWESQQMVQRVVQHQSQQVPQRLFLLNYAKYQGDAQQGSQQPPQQVPKQVPQLMKQDNRNKTEEQYVVSPVTKSLHEYIDEVCQQGGLQNKVSVRLLDELVARYGKLQLRVEVRKCAAWLVDHGKQDISTSRLTNWFAKAAEIQRRETNQQLEWQQAHKDPVIAQKARAAGVKPNRPEEFHIDPAIKQILASPPPNA